MSVTAFDVISPVDETVVQTVPLAGRDEVDARVDRAHRAFAGWRQVAPGAAFENSGQDCCARSRVLVQRSAFDRFMELLEPAVKGFTVGDPADPASAMGPLISARHREKVSS